MKIPDDASELFLPTAELEVAGADPVLLWIASAALKAAREDAGLLEASKQGGGHVAMGTRKIVERAGTYFEFLIASAMAVVEVTEDA